MQFTRRVSLILIVVLILIGVVLILVRSYGGEDSWIKDSRGVWIKHGNPSVLPDYVGVQQNALLCANKLYVQEKAKNVSINSQCLGVCGIYAVDLVHVPRTAEDDLPQNICIDYNTGRLSNFIEVGINGNIVRVKD